MGARKQKAEDAEVAKVWEHLDIVPGTDSSKVQNQAEPGGRRALWVGVGSLSLREALDPPY